MESLLLISGIISIVTFILFIFLFINVNTIKKRMRSDYDEYIICKMEGNVDKAFYHLHRAFYSELSGYVTENKAREYYDRFKELERGIPDYEDFDKLKKEDGLA